MLDSPPLASIELVAPSRPFRQYREMEWSTPRKPALLPKGFVEPCLPSARATAPTGAEWVHEIISMASA